MVKAKHQPKQVSPLDALDLSTKLPNDTYTNVRDVLEHRAQFKVNTRLGVEGYRYLNFGTGGTRWGLSPSFEGDGYLGNILEYTILDENSNDAHTQRIMSDLKRFRKPPFNDLKLAKMVGYGGILLMDAKPKNPEQTSRHNPYLAAFFHRDNDAHSRHVLVANMIFLNKEDFELIGKPLKEQPECGKDIFYKIPAQIARDNFRDLSEDDLKKIYNGYNDAHDYYGTYYGQIAAIYYVEKGDIRPTYHRVVELKDGKINVYGERFVESGSSSLPPWQRW
jgi:hypothetical protein